MCIILVAVFPPNFKNKNPDLEMNGLQSIMAVVAWLQFGGEFYLFHNVWPMDYYFPIIIFENELE